MHMHALEVKKKFLTFSFVGFAAQKKEKKKNKNKHGGERQGRQEETSFASGPGTRPSSARVSDAVST